MEQLITFYSTPQIGGSLPFFEGTRQIGGGFLGGLARFVLPFLKIIGKSVLNIASNTVNDVVDNRKTISESIVQNASKELINKMDKTIYSNKRPKLYRQNAVIAKRKK